MGAVQLCRESRGVSTIESPSLREQVTLVDLVDRVLGTGVVLTGDVTLAVADIDLVYVGLRVLLASVSSLEQA
jgi:Gas vesicle protein